MAEPGRPPPLARSPIAAAPPTTVVAGWEVSARRSQAALRIVDSTPVAKVLVRAAEDGQAAVALGVPFGRAARDGRGTLVVGSSPSEWLLLAAPGTAAAVAQGVPPTVAGELVTVRDFTHSRALVRVTGAAAADVLAKLCGIDLSDAVTSQGTALRTAVAELVTDVVRDDLGAARSYLLHCERSSGQYLFDVLVDAGAEFGIDVDGFAGPGV